MTLKSRLEKWKSGEVTLTLFREFEFFDPIDTPVLFAPFTAYSREARRILADRSSEEIRYSCMLAEWVVLAPIDELIETEFGENPELLAEMTGHDDETFPRLLQRRQSVLNIVGIPDLKKARWQELYAATALAYVARAARSGDTSSMEAAEATQIALSFAQRSASASKRHSAWKEKALRYADGKEDMSADSVARYFLEYYEDRIRTTKNGKLFAQRTVADWIRAARKQT